MNQSEAEKMGYLGEKDPIPKRMATCKTVELSRMIRILATEAKKIVQPTLKKE